MWRNVNSLVNLTKEAGNLSLNSFDKGMQAPLFNHYVFFICYPKKYICAGYKKTLMRLGQLARKLALRPSEIIDFLASNSVTVEDSSNTKLQNEHVTLVMQRFAPAMLAEVEKELIAEEQYDVVEQPSIESVKPAETAEVLVQDNAVPADDVGVIPALSDATEADKNEVIKAPKIALSGLKVVGKIDLPTPKKKETPAESSGDIPAENATPPKRRTEDRKEQKRERPYTSSQPRKNPVSLQREREAQEAEQRKREAAERKKEQRTRNYLNKVKSAPTKSMKIIDEQFEEISTDVSTPPKTWLGKFFRWLRS